MPIVIAGVAGLGAPEALVVFVVVLLIFLIGRAAAKSSAHLDNQRRQGSLCS